MNKAAFDRLDSLPRAQLNGPATPLTIAQNLSRYLQGPELLVKRDDIGPLAFGGNKLRQLEFYLGDALAKNADTVLITGAVQSNFVRLAAAGANRLGLSCHIQLEERVAKDDERYRNSGNVLLDRVLGATLHSYPHGEDEAGADANLETIASELRQQGKKPYVIHLGPGHESVGALGYVNAARELLGQLSEADITPSAVVVASGSGATHAGLLFGLRLAGSATPVIGACVRRSADAQFDRVQMHAESLSRQLETDNPLTSDDIILNDAFLAPGYGKPGPAAEEAIRLAARMEGFILDPVYTAKSFACCIDFIRKSERGSQPVVYVHTGGLPAIFAYEVEMLRAVG